VLLGRVVDRQSLAIDTLSRELERVSVPASPSLTEVTSLRGAGQLLTLEIARAKDRVDLCAPAESYRMLGPALRRASQSGVTLSLWSDEPATGEVATIQVIEPSGWPGRPLLAAIDEHAGLLASMGGEHVTGYWSGAPVLVAAARQAMRTLSGHLFATPDSSLRSGQAS
jgi:hypothetical protein